MQVFAVLLLGRVDIYQVVNLIQGGDDRPGIAEYQPDAPFEACAGKSFADQVFKFVRPPGASPLARQMDE